MTRKAKLKSTGQIIEVRVDMDYHGNATWLDAATNTEYYPSELELLPEEANKTQYLNKIDMKAETLDFGGAISALKAGKKVARKGWNGKGMFLWLKPAATVKSEWCKDPMLKNLAEANGGEIEALDTICMFTAQKQILSGWLASQTDMLSDDWMIVG